MKIRVATDQDARRIAEIYAPAVAESAISFELVPPPAEELLQRMRKIQARFPWLVAELEGEVVGYAYASEHHARAAYQWSVDVSVYVDPGQHRKGIGRALYGRLLPLLRELGYYNAYAGIALPNLGSVALHEAFGFRQFALYEEVGYKLGAWRDVGWWRLQLRPAGGEPEPPHPFEPALPGIAFSGI